MSITGDRHPPAFRPRADEDDPAPAYQHGAGFLLSRLGRMAEREWGQVTREVGLTTLEHAVLSVLEEFEARGAGGLAQGAVARRVGVDPRNLVATVAGLVSRGFVVADIDPHDRRARLPALAAPGSDALAQLVGRLAAGRSDFFAALGPQEYVTLEALLDRVYAGRVDA